MDEIERQLKSDAAAIEAEVSPALRQRIDASLRGVERAAPQVAAGGRGFSMWWISGLTGVACALLVLVLLNRTGSVPAVEPGNTLVVTTVPEASFGDQVDFPLRAEAAVFTEPLQDELEKLQSDLEKAREAVEADLRRGF